MFGTLGFRPQSLLPSLRTTAGLERLVFYHGPHPRSRDARAMVMKHCATLGVTAVAVEVDDAFDLIEVARRIRGDVRKARQEGAMAIRFNIAGGTRLMSSAALLVCILEGIPATYVHDDTNEEIHLPLLRMNYADRLSDQQKRILSFLVERADRPMNETALAKAMGVHKSTMNHHVRELVAKGVAEVVPDPKDSRAHLVRATAGAALLVD